MRFNLDSKVFEGATTINNMVGMYLPQFYTGPKDEYLAGRESAWLGLSLNLVPAYVVSGPDAAALFNRTCVNRDFGAMKVGQSKHALICNEKGHLIGDGTVMKEEGTTYRTYGLSWAMAPTLQYYVEKSGLDVHGEYDDDEYFFQIDGPKSLEIMEEATGTDLHDLKFARNKHVTICGTDMMVHRLGMSGCLAYEVHGKAENAEKVYTRLREVVEAYGGKPQGFGSYAVIQHTPGGYPNQQQHFDYPYFEDPDLAAYMSDFFVPMEHEGSDTDNPEDFYVNPYEIGWGYLVNFNHKFMGKEALAKAKAAPQRHVVTLEWNADDVADVFSSQLRGRDVEPYDPIETPADGVNYGHPNVLRGDKVLLGGEKIGIAVGRAFAYYEQRMISLAYLSTDVDAPEGTEVIVRWGDIGHPQKDIRATVAQFPYYQGEYRNETFDVEQIPHLADKQK